MTNVKLLFCFCFYHCLTLWLVTYWSEQRHLHISSLSLISQQFDAPLLPGRQQLDVVREKALCANLEVGLLQLSCCLYFANLDHFLEGSGRSAIFERAKVWHIPLSQAQPHQMRLLLSKVWDWRTQPTRYKAQVFNIKKVKHYIYIYIKYLFCTLPSLWPSGLTYLSTFALANLLSMMKRYFSSSLLPVESWKKITTINCMF